MNITIVTPWWNHPEFARDYLDAVAVRRDEDELLVVDNASDPAVTFAAIRLPTNAGFAGASNAGLEQAGCDAVLFLNNDIVMKDQDWLDKLRAAIEPGVLTGARIRAEQHGSVDGVDLPYLDGWCLAGMRDDLLELGGFDEGYEEPAYFSDNDLCLRARAQGMRLREQRIGLTHLTNGTAGSSMSPQVAAVTWRNRERFENVAAALLAGREAA